MKSVLPGNSADIDQKETAVMYSEEPAYSWIKARIQEIGKDTVPEVDFSNDRVMMITINKTLRYRSVYDAVRFSWKVSKERADRASYVLAVFQSIVIDVFEVDEQGWRIASTINFPEFGSNDVDRLAFSGSRVGNEVLKRYCWKRIPASYRPKGCASPVLYNFSI